MQILNTPKNRLLIQVLFIRLEAAHMLAKHCLFQTLCFLSSVLTSCFYIWTIELEWFSLRGFTHPGTCLISWITDTAESVVMYRQKSRSNTMWNMKHFINQFTLKHLHSLISLRGLCHSDCCKAFWVKSHSERLAWSSSSSNLTKFTPSDTAERQLGQIFIFY